MYVLVPRTPLVHITPMSQAWEIFMKETKPPSQYSRPSLSSLHPMQSHEHAEPASDKDPAVKHPENTVDLKPGSEPTPPHRAPGKGGGGHAQPPVHPAASTSPAYPA